MKRLALSLSLLISMGAAAQNTLDLTSQAMQRRAKMAEKALPQKSQIRQLQRDNAFPQAQEPMMALVKLHDGATSDDLVRDGFQVKSLRGGFAIVTCTPDEASRLATHKSVRKCELNRQRGFRMEKARDVSGVDALHTGLNLPQAYTGKGVIAGIVDGGFDPNHVNFKDAAGNSRFKYFSTVEPTSSATGNGVRITTYPTQTLALYTTDDNTQTHGTHTLGIMAGSYRGEATVGTYSNDTKKATVTTTNNPYYGVAYESNIYASTGSNYDALIAYAVDGILQYRWDNDHYTPIVVNLSLGGNQGPHDGSGLLTQFLDTCAVNDKAIICVSAGNEGDLPIAYHKTFTAEDNSFATFIRPYQYTDVRYGIVEFYSDTADDFDVSVILYNKARKKVARTFPLNNKQGQIQYICSSEEYRQDESDIVDPTFAKAYQGYVGVGGMLDEESGRFYAAIDYYAINSDENPADEKTTEAQYTLGFLVTGKAGQRVDCYCDGTFTALDSYDYEGYVDGMRNGSISDIATGRNTIAVGSYNTKAYAGSIYGQPLGYDGYYKEGEVTEFSSFGTLIDGRNLPHLLAPGNLVVSSVSTPYMKNTMNGVTDQIVSAKYNDGRRDHCFYPQMGTSMASPFVAGTVALMLEADPTLTFDRARDILMRTATRYAGINRLPDPVQVGAGKLNSLEAVKLAIEEGNAIGSLQEADRRVLFIPIGYRTFQVCLPGASQMDVALYTISGAKVIATKARGSETTVDASALTPGIYVATVNGTHAQKIAIK